MRPRSYEVTKDGLVVQDDDARSYVDFDLEPGVTYRVGVTPIRRDGGRDLLSFVEFDTSGNVRQLGSDGVGFDLMAPKGLRAAVYSRTAGEIFWERSSHVGQRYEVVRDGVPVATSDAVSYFDDTLAGGTAYVHEVFALDGFGERASPPASVTLTTLGSSLYWR